MTPSQLRAKVVAERAAWVREMLAGVRGLPLSTVDEFLADPRNVAAAESYLRRALEALLDLGRHILAKGFGIPTADYKKIARSLRETGVLNHEGSQLLEQMAGYRNRMVHFDNEVSATELYELSADHLDDIDQLLQQLLNWIRSSPEKIDHSL